MKVILLKSFKNLGSPGDVISVKPGYAKNYLIPMKVVNYATKEFIKNWESKKDEILKENEKVSQNANVIKEKINDKIFVFIRPSNDDGRIFGSVSTRDVLEALKKSCKEELGIDFEINRGDVNLGNGIKNIGIHDCQVNLYGDVVLNIKLNVCRTEMEGVKFEKELKDSKLKKEKPEVDVNADQPSKNTKSKKESEDYNDQKDESEDKDTSSSSQSSDDTNVDETDESKGDDSAELPSDENKNEA